jgi:DNA-binding HxlR family transcriptional regulator
MPAVELLLRRSTASLVLELAGGPQRLSELQSKHPQLDEHLLSEVLRELSADGVIERRVDPGPPFRVVYELTPAGRELAPTLSELAAWAERWLDTGLRSIG